MSNRRKLKPHETARRDQAMAMAREWAHDPHTAVHVTDYAEPGMQCSWCDCPVDEEHARPGYVCAGCQQPATYVVALFYGSPSQADCPVCTGHYADVVKTVNAMAPGAELVVAPAWEDDDD